MRFLRVLRLRCVVARFLGHEPVAIGRTRLLSRTVDRLRRHLHAVGPHVGDDTALVEPLGHLHGSCRCEAHAAGGRLLQRRGGEGRAGVPLGRLGLDRCDAERCCLQHRLDRCGGFLVLHVEPLHSLALPLRKVRRERLPALRLHLREDAPVFLRVKAIDLVLALANEAKRYGLYAPGRAGTR